MTIALSNIFTNPDQLYNGFYPKRPVWGIIATTNSTTPSATNNFFYTFNRQNPFTPQSFDYMAGSSNPNIALGRRIGQDEVSVSSYYFSGNSGTQMSSQSWSPTSSYYGCQNISQTGANFYFDANDTGWSQFYDTNQRGLVFPTSGVVIGEPNFNQTFDLIAFNGRIMKIPIGVSQRYVDTPNVNSDFFFASTQVYVGEGSPSGTGAGLGVSTMTSNATTGTDSNARRNRGMICHNRRTGKLAYLEATSTNYVYRLHIVDLQFQIGQSTTTAQILAGIDAAVAAGGARYNFYTLTFPSMNQAVSQLQMQMARLVLCDDNTLWVHFWDKDNSSSSGVDRLYRCTNTATYAPLQVGTQNTTTSYGINDGVQYGNRHMNSDDNSRVAFYNPYFYYCAGINAFIVNTYTAATAGSQVQWMGYTQQTSSGCWPIVPTGGNGFFVGDPVTNQDGGSGVRGQFFNTTVLAGQTQSFQESTRYMLPTINQSTAYQSWAPVKVQPTLEFKPSND